MTREDFYAALHTVASGSTPEAARAWIDFAVERVDEEQYVHFRSSGRRETDVERWLDTIYGGMCLVRTYYGGELTGKLAELSLEQCCMYPGEMLQAAECLCGGGNAETIREMVANDAIEIDAPEFPVALHPLDERDCGPDVGIAARDVPCGLVQTRMEPGYVLQNGIVLLESERDESGCYRGGAGMDGMYLNTGTLYRPVYDREGELLAFRPVRPSAENCLAIVEMSVEQNYDHIDGVVNNGASHADAPPSIRESLRQFQPDAAKGRPAEKRSRQEVER